MNRMTFSAKEMTDDINDILGQYQVRGRITLTDLVVTENTVWDQSWSEPLSTTIIEHLWPHIESDEVYHFTTARAAESIEQSRIFRLYNLERRNSEGEIEAFCRAHHLDGYLKLDEQGAPMYRRELMPQLFYASFAPTHLDAESERNLWSSFAPNDGARLKFKVSARNRDFRRMYYPAAQEPIPLLRAPLSAKIQ